VIFVKKIYHQFQGLLSNAHVSYKKLLYNFFLTFEVISLFIENKKAIVFLERICSYVKSCDALSGVDHRRHVDRGNESGSSATLDHISRSLSTNLIDQ
jgi:hypothetical protein